MWPSTVGLTQERPEQAPACQEPVWSVGCLLVSGRGEVQCDEEQDRGESWEVGQNLVGMGGSGCSIPDLRVWSHHHAAAAGAPAVTPGIPRSVTRHSSQGTAAEAWDTRLHLTSSSCTKSHHS